MRHAWLTPNSAPIGLVRFCVYVPNTDMFIWALQGALSEFERPEKYEDVFGVVSPEQAAEYWLDANEQNLPLVECEEISPMGNRIGTFFWWAGTGVPSGAVVCDGGQYAPETYPDLFAAIGYTWGRVGDDFLLPDLREFGIIGAAYGLDVGESIGSENVTLTSANLPSMVAPIRRNIAGGTNSYVLAQGFTDGATAVNSLPFGGTSQPFSIRNPDRVMLPCIEAYVP